MNSFISHLKKFDWIITFSAFSLCVFGLLSIYSSSFRNGDFLNFKKQIVFFAVGICLMIAVSFFDYRILRNNSYLILFFYFLCLVSLAGLFIFAPVIRGVRSWYKIGLFSFDPIEPAKIVLIILLAKYFSTRHVEMYKIWHIFLSGVYVLLPSLLVLFQPDLGSVLILIAIWVGILIVSGIKIRHFLILALCFVFILILSWNSFLKDYQKDRILSLLFPYDELGVSWSQNQAQIAIGSGSILGKGFKHGSQTQYGFLPEPHTDFIFAAIAEETGFLGIGILFLLFGLFFWRVREIILSSQYNFARLFALGFAIFIFFQLFVNIGMNLGLMPIIGLPLPFISYGGSSLTSIFIGLGILQNIKINQYKNFSENG